MFFSFLLINLNAYYSQTIVTQPIYILIVIIFQKNTNLIL